MKSLPDARTTKPATMPPTKAENERPGVEQQTRAKHSAVILGRLIGDRPGKWEISEKR